MESFDCIISTSSLNKNKTQKLLLDESLLPKDLDLRSPQTSENSLLLSSYLSQSATIENAQLHGQANLVYKSEESFTLNSERCPCCKLPIKQKQFSLFCSNLELNCLGASFPLFFTIVKYLIFWMLFVFIFACIPCIVQLTLNGNMIVNSSKEDSNRRDNFTVMMPFLHCIMCFLMMPYFLFYRNRLRRKVFEVEMKSSRPSDFTLLIKGLPKTYKNEELKSHIEKYIAESEIDIKIVSIVVAYNMSKFLKYQKKKRRQAFTLNYIQKYQISTGVYPKKLTWYLCLKKYNSEETYKEKINRLESLQNKCLQKIAKKNLTSYAFVTFNKRLETRKFFNLWRKSYWSWLISCCFFCCTKENFHNFKGNYIYAKLPAEPCDIYWGNLSKSGFHKSCNRFITFIVVFLTISLTFSCLLPLQQLQVSSTEENNISWELDETINFSISLVTVIINILLSFLIRKYSKFESYISHTTYNLSVMDKIVIFMFFNTIILKISVYAGAHGSHWFAKDGLAYSVFWLEMVNAFVSPILYLINFENLVKMFRRYLAIKNYNKIGVLKLSQYRANKIFQGPKLDLADRFANILKTVVLSLFFAPIVPIGVLIGILGIIFETVIFKYMLIRVHNRPRKHNAELALEAWEWVPWVMIGYIIGIMIFYLGINEASDSVMDSLLSMCICFVILMFISKRCKCCCDNYLKNIMKITHIDEKANDYFEFLPSFTSDYERENHVTRKIGWEKWIKFAKQKRKEIYYNY
ncbi:hypothetical protein SteCoe_28337 [Stentor coeruleus]|uniref:CSC1/OSCA1-like cytosolic domain-containing protein n=1 Tax=Stentor coeruleus TaxID=5963 RepID=A0A1R2B8Z7_9CILI|nr:hypothetical protein SteCoe_28337 [Stentor coeruleus]